MKVWVLGFRVQVLGLGLLGSTVQVSGFRLSGMFEL